MNRDDLKFRVWDARENEYTDKDWLLTQWGSLADPLDEAGMFYAPSSCSVERCTGFTDNYEIPIYEKDRIKIEDPIKGIEQDTEYCVGWIKGCWYALGAHGMQRLSELLENHSVLVLGTIHG